MGWDEKAINRVAARHKCTRGEVFNYYASEVRSEIDRIMTEQLVIWCVAVPVLAIILLSLGMK